MLFYAFDLFSHVVQLVYLLLLHLELSEFKYICHIGKLDFLGNEASRENILFYIFPLLFPVESLCVWSYRHFTIFTRSFISTSLDDERWYYFETRRKNLWHIK